MTLSISETSVPFFLLAACNVVTIGGHLNFPGAKAKYKMEFIVPGAVTG